MDHVLGTIGRALQSTCVGTCDTNIHQTKTCVCYVRPQAKYSSETPLCLGGERLPEQQVTTYPGSARQERSRPSSLRWARPYWCP